MKFSRDKIKYRYVFDIVTGTLHDLKSAKSPGNPACDLERMQNWIVFDTDREPVKGALIKKLTATKEVVGIEVRKICPKCMSPEDENVMDLLKDYFLSQSE